MLSAACLGNLDRFKSCLKTACTRIVSSFPPPVCREVRQLSTHAPRLAASCPLRKPTFLSHLYLKTIILPRQARDKHRENSKKDAVFPTGDRCLLRVALLPGHHRIRLTHINTQPKPAGAHTHGGRHTQRRTRQRQPSAARRKEKSPDNEPKKKKALARCQRCQLPVSAVSAPVSAQPRRLIRRRTTASAAQSA